MQSKEKIYIFNKLIRDKIPELFQEEGSGIDVRELSDKAEFLNLLYKKAQEELQELFTAKSSVEIIEECADLEEVLQTFKQLHRISQDQVEVARLVKQQQRGAYNRQLFLTTVRCKDGSRSDTCAIKNGYPEITENEYQVLCAHNERVQRERE